MFEIGERCGGVAREAHSTTCEQETGEPRAILVVPARTEGAPEMLDRLELLERFARAALFVGELRECETGGNVTRMREYSALQGAMRFDGTARMDEPCNIDRCGRAHAARGSE